MDIFTHDPREPTHPNAQSMYSTFCNKKHHETVRELNQLRPPRLELGVTKLTEIIRDARHPRSLNTKKGKRMQPFRVSLIEREKQLQKGAKTRTLNQEQVDLQTSRFRN